MNNNLFVITNNPQVNANYNSKISVTYSEEGYLGILKQARNKIHEGCKLITHPLMGSIKPNETPYRSLILEKGSGLDFQSLEIIESSLQSTEKFLKDNQTPLWSEKVLKDFQFVDLRLFESALQSTILL